MDKKIAFVWIFVGVIAAGALVLGIGFIVHAFVTGNAVVTIITLFAVIAGAIMMGLGLIAMLICLLLITFGVGRKLKDKKNEAQPQNTESIEFEQQITEIAEDK